MQVRVIPTVSLASLSPRAIKTAPKLQYQFGVAWDEQTAEVLNAIIQDVMALRAELDDRQELLVVSTDSNFVKTLNAFPGVVLSEDPLVVKRCSLWKLYYENVTPEVPSESPGQVYYRKVGANEVNTLRLTQSETGGYPSLYNPADEREIPVGYNPSINKIPPRYYTNMPYTLQQPWW